MKPKQKSYFFNLTSSIIVLLSFILIVTMAFSQKSIDISNPRKINPREFIARTMVKELPQRHIRSERVIKPEHQRSDHCEEGYVDDCSGDGDCCPESWIGDNFMDCIDQQYGCDLECYDLDGGDCAGDPDQSICGDGFCDLYENSETCPEDCDNNSVTVTDYTGSPITAENSSGVYESGTWYYEMFADTILIKATFSYFEGMWSDNLRLVPQDNSLPEFISFSVTTIGSNGGGGGPSLNYNPMNEGEIQIQDWGENGIYSGMIVQEFDSDIPFWTDTELPDISCTEWNECPEFFYCKSDYDDCSTADNTGTCVFFHYGECGYENDPVCSCDGYTVLNECWAAISFQDIAYGGECVDDCCSPGDFNCDTNIDVLDIVAIINCVVDDADCPCGDLDDDGSVNVLDIVILVNMILGNN